MTPVTTILSFILLIQIFLIIVLHERLSKLEQLLKDVSLDINVYEQMKAQVREVKAKKPANKVGTWKK